MMMPGPARGPARRPRAGGYYYYRADIICKFGRKFRRNTTKPNAASSYLVLFDVCPWVQSSIATHLLALHVKVFVDSKLRVFCTVVYPVQELSTSAVTLFKSLKD